MSNIAQKCILWKIMMEARACAIEQGVAAINPPVVEPRALAAHQNVDAAGTHAAFRRPLRLIIGAAVLEPIRKLLESNESDVIPYWALDSFGSARCGSLNTAVLRIATAFVIRVI